MNKDMPEAPTSLGLFLAPGGEIRALRVEPGEPGPGDQWRVPAEPAREPTAEPVPATQPPQLPERPLHQR
jgi:hypothetical protein